MAEALAENRRTSRWILIILFIIGALVIVLISLNNSNVLKEIWLWVVGLIGTIVAFFRRISDGISNLLIRNDIAEEEKLESQLETCQVEKGKYESRIKDLENQLESLSDNKDMFDGITLTVLRYIDDGNTTLGLLFIDNKFFCYTLEDTFRQIKVKGQTRIPCGTYKVNFLRQLTPLTQKYRQTRPWFEYHLEIQNVENFTGVYIHSGSNHKHTEGCLLVGRDLSATNTQKTISSSRLTFEELYKLLKPKLDSGEYLRITILDEGWFEQKMA